jgi:hypothetical protein
MQHNTVYFIWKLLYMFWVVPLPIIRSANNCIYSMWYLSHRYCYLPISWKSWNWFECAVCGVRHPNHTISADSNNGVINTRCCRYSCSRSWWWVVVPPETYRAVSRWNKLCNVASCWKYIRIKALRLMLGPACSSFGDTGEYLKRKFPSDTETE